MSSYLSHKRKGFQGGVTAFDGFGNRSRSFDGVSDYVSIPDNTDIPTGAQTIAFWMKLNTLTELVRPLTKFGSSDGQRSFLFVILTDGTIKNVINDTGSGEDNNPISSAASTISTGIWYHVAMRFIPSTEQTLYINGSSVASDTTNIPSQIFNSTAPIMVGSDPTFASYFDGNLADIRIYDTDLTATDISDIYNGTNITTNLAGHWLTDADNLLDVAGSNNGTNYGSKYSYDNPSPPVEFGRASRSFNGTSDCIDMGDVDGSIWQGVGAKFSIALWVKGIPTNSGIIFGKYGAYPTAQVEWAVIGRNNGDFDFTAYGSLAGSSYVRETTDVAALLSSWVHIGVSFDQTQTDADKIKVAVNGSFVSTTQILVGSNIAIQNGTEDLCIGSRDEGTGFLYNGKIADVRIYSTLLAESDFSDLASGVDVGTPWGHWLTDNDDVEDKAGTNDGTNFGSTYSYEAPLPANKLIDTYASACGAYSLRELTTAWAGQPVVEVRRVSDGAYSDFTASEITDGTLATWCQGAGAFVRTWYDQSGNGVDVTQTTEGDQPRIATNGVVESDNGKPAINFDTASAGFSNTGSFDYEGGVSWYAVTHTTVNSNQDRVWCDDKIGEQGFVIFYTDGTNYINDGAGYKNHSSSGGTTNQQLRSYNFDGSQGWYVYGFDGSFTDGFFGGWGGSIEKIDTSNIAIGQAGAGGHSYQGKMQELIIYPNDQRHNKENIERNINEFYSIY